MLQIFFSRTAHLSKRSSANLQLTLNRIRRKPLCDARASGQAISCISTNTGTGPHIKVGKVVERRTEAQPITSSSKLRGIHFALCLLYNELAQLSHWCRPTALSNQCMGTRGYQKAKALRALFKTEIHTYIAGTSFQFLIAEKLHTAVPQRNVKLGHDTNWNKYLLREAAKIESHCNSSLREGNTNISTVQSNKRPCETHSTLSFSNRLRVSLNLQLWIPGPAEVNSSKVCAVRSPPWHRRPGIPGRLLRSCPACVSSVPPMLKLKRNCNQGDTPSSWPTAIFTWWPPDSEMPQNHHIATKSSISNKLRHILACHPRGQVVAHRGIHVVSPGVHARAAVRRIRHFPHAL